MADNESLRGEINKLNDQLKALITFEEEKKSLDKEILDLKGQIKDLHEQLSSKSQNETKFDLQSKISKETIQTLNSKLKKSMADNESLRGEINKLNDQLKALITFEEEKKSLDKEILDLKGQIKDLHEQLSSKSQNETKFDLQLKNSKETIQTLNSKLKKSMADNESLRGEVNTLNDQLNLSKKDVDSLKLQLQDSKLAVDRQKSQLDASNSEFDRLNSQLNDSRSTVDDLKKKLYEANDQINGQNNLIKICKENELINVDMIKKLDTYVNQLENQIANEKTITNNYIDQLKLVTDEQSKISNELNRKK
jgi:chromosome segregation ATPase